MPIFEREVISSLEDKMTLPPPSTPSRILLSTVALQALVEEVGLVPSDAVMAEPTERIRIFDEKSRVLSDIFSQNWVHEVQAEFVPFNQDRELGLAISSQGSLDPPSRRSQGINSYLGLTAKLLALGKRADKARLFLLDDPAMHLHPLHRKNWPTCYHHSRFKYWRPLISLL